MVAVYWKGYHPTRGEGVDFTGGVNFKACIREAMHDLYNQICTHHLSPCTWCLSCTLLSL